MSSFKSVSYNTNQPESSDNQQRQQLHHQYSQPHHQQQQHHQLSHQQDPHSHMNIFEMPPGRNDPHAQFMDKKPVLARIEGEEEELVVIGSGISGTFEHVEHKRLPLKLPNLNYKYPESSTQNFSPGTSLTFNAYRGHHDLLTQPFMATIEDVDRSNQRTTYPRIQSSLSQEIHPDHPQQQQLAYPPEVGGHSSYHQQRSPYPGSYDHQYHPYLTDSHPRDSRDSRDYREYPDSRDPQDYGDRREYEDPMNRSGQQSPRMSTSTAVHRTSIASPSRTEQSYNSQPRVPEHSDFYRPREEYPPHPSSYSQHPSSQPPQNTSPETGRHIPASSHSAPSMPQNWRRPDSDHPNVHNPYDGNSRYQTSQSQPSTWDDNKPAPSAAIDIPQPRNRGAAGYANNVSMHDSMDSNIRSQNHQSQYGQGSYSHRQTGPRYSLSRVNYRMIYEYANEIRECLIKGKPGSTDRLLYNAEILSKVFLGCRADIDPNAPTEEEPAQNPHQLRCTSCNIVKTPEWRKGPLGPRTLCNACGLIWGKMSRSKAALVKSKQGPASTNNTTTTTATTTATTNDVNMTDAAPESQGEGDAEISPTSAYPNSASGPRKRGREMSSTTDADDEEALARDEDRLAIERSRLELEAAHLSDPDEPQQDQSQQLSSEDTPLDEQTGDQTRFGSNSSEDSSNPMTPGEEAPTAGRKLALSFLLG
ncbi:blue light receptor [Mortierella sp. AD011]|nr:blue light receptor [Mortierella sp. AD011]